MMTVSAVEAVDMQITGGGIRESLPELVHKLQVEIPDALHRKLCVKDQKRTTGKINRGLGERFVHRQDEETVPSYPFFIAKRGGDRGTQRDTDVLDRVVSVDVKIALNMQAHVHLGMRRKKGQHMVEESQPRRNIRRPGSVEIDLQTNLRLFGQTLDARFAFHFITPRRSLGLQTASRYRAPLRYRSINIRQESTSSSVPTLILSPSLQAGYFI